MPKLPYSLLPHPTVNTLKLSKHKTQQHLNLKHLKKTLLLLLILLIQPVLLPLLSPLSPVSPSPAYAASGELIDDLWITNGTVRAIAPDDNGTIYIGGDFTYVGPKTGGFAALNTSTGAPDLSFPKTNGPVFTTISDGAGGWYIGGNFTQVGAYTRNRIAHILPDKTVNPEFNPGVDRAISTMTLSGDTLYIGGYFTSVGGQNRANIASINTFDGTTTSFNPNVGGTVHAIAIFGSDIFIGGDFWSVNGVPRIEFAKLNTSGEVILECDPNFLSYGGTTIYSIQVTDDYIYVGGNFYAVGGEDISSLARLRNNSACDLDSSWNPNANNSVSTLAVSGNTVYVGGDFTSIGGQNRNRLAAINTTDDGTATSWNPNPVNSQGWVGVNALTVLEDTVYVGGSFTSIGGETRNRIAAINTTDDGTATSWDPNANNSVSTLAVSGNTVYAGGYFTSIGGETRNRLAAINTADGTATSWDPNANGYVNTLFMAGDKVYAGGAFTSIGEETRNYIAALNTADGTATSWNPNANNSVSTLAVSGNTVYAGGYFTSIGGQSRNRIASINTTDDGKATSWNPNANNAVSSLFVAGDKVYVGGSFTSIGGQSRNRIASINTTDDGTATSWDPNANNAVSSLFMAGDKVYVGGAFTSIGGQSRNRIASVNTTDDGTATSWNPNANQQVNTLTIAGNKVYVGGSFTSIGGQSRNRIAAINNTDGLVSDWDPSVSKNDYSTPYVASLAFSGSTLYVGGDFTVASGQDAHYLTAFSFDFTAPSISSISTTNHTITWNTDKPSSSMVEYGVNTHYGSVTEEFDTNPRVNSHAVELANLLTCTNYNYRVISVDSAGNSTISEDNSFTTLGCTGNAEILTQDKDDIPTETGGTLALSNTEGEGGETTLLLTVPSGFLPNEAVTANFQAKRLNSALVAKQAPLPKAYSRQVGHHTYDLRALVDTANYINEFDKPLTITLSYTDEQVKGISPHDLAIHRYDGTTWHMLESTVDTGSKTVTASTRLFSIFALLAKSEKEEVSRSSSSHHFSSSSHPKAPTCSDPKPSSIPDLFQIDVSARSAKLYFTPISNTSRFFISFAENPRAEAHGELVSLAREGVQSHSIYHLQPNTTYYVKVRGQKGCMPGDWSNIMMIKTPAVSSNRVSKYYRYLY